MSRFKQLAIIGPTASGKSDLAIKTAQYIDAYILSLDSLSIYKEINIVSAKPTKAERAEVMHFGIDHLYPNEPFDVTTFIQLYQKVHKKCREDQKNLVIVGGTSFYLKMLLEGVSQRPPLSEAQQTEIRTHMRHPSRVHRMLSKVDPAYMQSISSSDTYRIQKALEIYTVTGEKPSIYFAAHPPKTVIEEPLPLYEIQWDRSQLRERIRQRTEQMVRAGLIDEIIILEKRYTRAPNCMKAIGIKETLAYLDGVYDKQTMIEKISVNTGRLAKRQETFNRSQFANVTRGSLKDLEKLLLENKKYSFGN